MYGEEQVVAGAGLDAVMTAIGQLPADADQAPDVVLVERMRQLVQARARLDAALAEQVRVFDARGAARYDGQTSSRAWLGSRLRLGTDAGRVLQVARRLDRLPQLAKAFTAGEFTLEHAAVIGRLAGQVSAEALVEYEPILLELARQAPPEQLRVACEQVRQLLDPDGQSTEAARARRRRYLAAARTVGGMVHLQGLLDPAAGDVVLAALAAAMPVPAAYEERTAGQRRADALTDICAGWLAAGEAPRSGGIRPQVQVTISWRALRSVHPLGLVDERDQPAREAGRRVRDPLYGVGIGSGQPRPPAGGEPVQLGDVPVLADGQPISIADARRLACDAAIIPVVLGSGSEPLDIGRQSRVVPVGLRRALNLRDGGCRFAGCDRPASWCDAHHIRHWADGGPTCKSNMVLLCDYHHTLVHEGWRMHGDPDGTLWFQRPDGTRLDLTSEPRCRPPTRGP